MALSVKELQIGDWVLHCNRPCKVLGIKDIHKRHDAILLFGQNGFSRKGFEPIPLTHEILEKNGFVEDDEHDWFIYDDGNNYFIIEFCREIGTDEIVAESFMSFGRCECIYVHELQHDLKRCRLTDLADSIII